MLLLLLVVVVIMLYSPENVLTNNLVSQPMVFRNYCIF
jgi:hypothetical protein